MPTCTNVHTHTQTNINEWKEPSVHEADYTIIGKQLIPLLLKVQTNKCMKYTPVMLQIILWINAQYIYTHMHTYDNISSVY